MSVIGIMTAHIDSMNYAIKEQDALMAGIDKARYRQEIKLGVHRVMIVMQDLIKNARQVQQDFVSSTSGNYLFMFRELTVVPRLITLSVTGTPNFGPSEKVDNFDKDGTYLALEVVRQPGTGELLRRDVLVRVEKGRALYNAVYDEVQVEPLQLVAVRDNKKYAVSIFGNPDKREIIPKKRMDLIVRYDVKLAFRGLIPSVSLDFLKAMFIESSYVDTCRQMNYHKMGLKASGIAMNWRTHGATNLDKLFDNLIKRSKAFKFSQTIDINYLTESALPTLVVGSETAAALRAHLLSIEAKYTEGKKKLNDGYLKIVAEAFEDETLLAISKRNSNHPTERSRGQFGTGEVEKSARQLQLSLINVHLGDEFHERELFARMIYYKYGDAWRDSIAHLGLDKRIIDSYNDYIESTFKRTDTTSYLETTLEPAKEMERKKQKLRDELEEELKDIQPAEEEEEDNESEGEGGSFVELHQTWSIYDNIIYLKLDDLFYPVQEIYMGSFIKRKERSTNTVSLLIAAGKAKYKTGVSSHDDKHTIIKREGKKPYHIMISNPSLERPLACALHIKGDGEYYCTDSIFAAIFLESMSDQDVSLSNTEKKAVKWDK